MQTTLYKDFKPNLIPNSKVSSPIDLREILGDKIDGYVLSLKKDGCRIEVVGGKLLSRALKPITSTWIQKRFFDLAQKCLKYGIILEGEFYSHGMKFNEINRFFKTEDVTDTKHLREMEADTHKYNLTGTIKHPIWVVVKDADKLLEVRKTHSSKFEQDWPGRTPEWMSTYHESLQLWPFDCIIELNVSAPFRERMKWLFSQIHDKDGLLHEFKDIVNTNGWFNLCNEQDFSEIYTYGDLEKLYEESLDLNWEGLVITHHKRTYKYGRSTAREATIFKMKEDKLEYDGQVLDIVEGTIARSGAPRSTNELGRSVTSKLAHDREPSGIASGILSEFEGHKITVSFDGYDHDELRELLANKDKYVGQWFKYTGMKPVKNVPRHAHMTRNSWRDSK